MAPRPLRALLVGQAHAVVGGDRLEDVVALGAQGGGRIRPRAAWPWTISTRAAVVCRDGAIAA
jgi:hypothetical protein